MWKYGSRGIPISIFLNLSKAFDTLDNSILLNKLKYYGVENNAFGWFSSYLTNRYQYVDIEGVRFKISSTKTGVPQGSILGLLFSFYTFMICTPFQKSSYLFHMQTTLLFPILSSL